MGVPPIVALNDRGSSSHPHGGTNTPRSGPLAVGVGGTNTRHDRGHVPCTIPPRPYTLKIAPSFFPSMMLAPTSVTVSSAIPHTPIALAMYGPSASRFTNV